ncbi:hypothetical protein HY857_01275 [Candidatus Saccharibacteria bacterium]|nr:hypothetical protein [Candidatus Saccharibacteria bacterium]
MANKNSSEPKNKSRLRPRWRSRLVKIVKLLADSPLPEVAFIGSFVLARWWQNSDFSYVSEIWIPLALFAVLSAIVFYIFRLILGKGLATHLAALFVSYCLYGYGFVKDSSLGKNILKLWPDKWQTEFSSSMFLILVLATTAGLIGWVIKKYILNLKPVRNLQPYKVVLFAIAFLFVLQLVKTGQRVWAIHKVTAYNYPTSSITKPSSQPEQKPDIYYLLFDRYGNQDALKNNFNFNNSDIYSYLSSQGFTNRPDAYANYPFTMSSVSSTMAMSYFPEFQKMFGEDGDWQNASAYRSILNNPPIAQILKQNGYDYNQLSSWWDFTRVGIKADSNPTISFRLNAFGYQSYLTDLQRDVIDKSVLSPWLKKGVRLGGNNVLKYDLTRNPQQNFEAQMTAFKNLASRADKSTPQFSFAHVLVPHDPYVFDADGNTPAYDGARTDNGVDETVKYTNAVTYLNKRIKDTVGYIRSHSPDAVIIIQADEGPYPKEFRYKLEPGHYYDPANLGLDKMKQKFSVFASYYLPGVDPSSKPINSSVDTFRFVLDHYLGYNLSMLPDCHFSTGDKYTIYKYQDQTAKLGNQTDAVACEQYL